MKLVLAVMTAALALTPVSALAAGATSNGWISDAMCGAKHAGTGAACAKKCIGMGSPAVLIVGTKIYTVSNPAKLNAFAGKTVTVDGSVAGDTITVASVK